MKNILINSTKHPNLATKIHKAGYNVIRSSNLNEQYDYALIDHDKFISEKLYTAKHILNPKKEFILLADNLEKIDKSILLNSGISRVLLYNEENILNFFHNLQKKPPHSLDTGYFLIFDSHEPNRKIFSSILYPFSCKPIYCNDLDTFFKALNENNIAFSLLNLGTPNLDLNEFIRQAYLNKDIKKVPLIAYRNQGEDIYIKEAASGLNRITSYILKFDELLSFMLEFISRKKISQCTSQICELYEFNKLHKYSKLSLPEIYFNFKDSLFEPMNAFNYKNLNSSKEYIELIKYFILHIESFNWLK